MMRVANRLNRFRVRCVHIVFCGIIFCAIYIVLYRDLGIGLPAAELDNKLIEVPLRFRIADGWVWKDDIDYSGSVRNMISTNVIDKPESNQSNDELPPSVEQDTGLDYGQGRYLELEGVEDYILWQKGYLEPTKKQVNRRIRNCKEAIQNILFLKTHYTGSDVVANILNRFADLRSLRIALPSGGLSTFYWPSRFHWKYVDIMLLDGTLPNILCNHARFNGDVMDEIMQPQTAFITILRDPVSHFEMTFRNLDFQEILEMEDEPYPFLKFLENPRKYIGRAIQHKRFKDSLNLIKNGMFFDLGLRTTDYHKTETVRDAILDIDDKFTLVLIYEYLDESLVMLKRRLCWELDDILYLKFHYQLHGESTHQNISGNISEQIYRWNNADMMLYQHFNETLWNDIRREGKEFYEEVREFRSKHEEMELDCLGKSINLAKIQLNRAVSSLNRYLCEKMLYRDIEYLHYFRRKMENNKRRTPTNSIGSGNGTSTFLLQGSAVKTPSQRNETETFGFKTITN